MTDTLARLKTALADRYAIQEELGAGGMATVYLAEDLKHHRKVAVKVLRPELAAVLGAERFVQEIETTANLQRPHILPLFDSGEADGDGRRVATWVARVIVDRPGRERGAVALTITFSVSERVHELSGVCQNTLTPERSRDRLASLGL